MWKIFEIAGSGYECFVVSLGKFLGNELWKEHYGSLLCLVIYFKAGRHKIYGDDSQQEFGRYYRD